jgi:hypothetical protein
LHLILGAFDWWHYSLMEFGITFALKESAIVIFSYVKSVCLLKQKYRMNKMSFREKARLNVCIAKDLAENFGGKKVDYLKMLNQKLREQIIQKSSSGYSDYYAKAA